MKAEHARQALLERKRELLERLNKIRADIGRGLDKDSSERAVELENAEVLNEIAKVTEEELEKVETELQQSLHA